MIAVLIPTLNRPHRVAEIVANLKDTAPEAVPYFIIEEHDTATAEAIEAIGSNKVVNKRAASYAGAINTAIKETKEPYILMAADDLLFKQGWAEPILKLAKDFGFVGTNDLHNPDVLRGTHATHYLITREYAELGSIDDPDAVLYEGYIHNYTDTEAVATAKFRGQWTPCLESVIEHLHWVWGLATQDATYQKGTTTVSQDEQTFNSRAHLWTHSEA
jgi:glycosyltransferase involved in cell wall biosynthesis